MKNNKKVLLTLLSLLLMLVLLPISITNNEVEAESNDDGNYLTFTAEQDNSFLSFSYVDGSNVMYRMRAVSSQTWTAWDDFSSGQTIVYFEKAGGKVQFKGTDVVTDADNHFLMSGKFAASGDVTSLTNGVGGDAVLETSCYASMFKECAALTTAPNLPAQQLSGACYESMFMNCTNLTTAPELPSTSLAAYCYAFMFQGCSSLEAATELPATILKESCYRSMFALTALTSPVDISHVTAVDDGCCACMYEGCPNIVLSSSYVHPQYKDVLLMKKWKATSAENAGAYPNWCQGMFEGTTVVQFISEITANNIYYTSGQNDDCITFSSPQGFSLTVKNPSDAILFWSTDKINWYRWNYEQLFSSKNAPYVLYMCGTADNGHITGGTDKSWNLTGTDISCSGNIETLRGAMGDEPSARRMDPACYAGMFMENVDSLVDASNLKLTATILSPDCYLEMFNVCLRLKVAPELPATTMATNCYKLMFMKCEALTSPTDLSHVTSLAENCFEGMFAGCVRIKMTVQETKAGWKTPNAVEVSNWCNGMFDGTGGEPLKPSVNTQYWIADLRDIQYTLSDNINTTYDGNSHTISINVTEPANDYYVEYSIDDGKTWTSGSSFTRTNVTGLTDVIFRIKAQNYVTTITDSRELVINPIIIEEGTDPTFTGSTGKISYTKGNAKDCRVRINRDYSAFQDCHVLKDGVDIGLDNYYVEPGSTFVVIDKSYLNKLSTGVHTFEVLLGYGDDAYSYSLVITIKAAPTPYVPVNTSCK